MMKKFKERIKFRVKRSKEKRFDGKVIKIQEFANKHKGFLVIVCDPKDDMMFTSFRGKQICARIKSEDGKKHRVIKNMLKASTFNHQIDRFIGALIFGLKIKLKEHSMFFHIIDAAIFNISKALRKTK